MRASFQGQNIFALGNGIAVLKYAWREAEPPHADEEKKQKIKRDAVELAKSVIAAGK